MYSKLDNHLIELLLCNFNQFDDSLMIPNNLCLANSIYFKLYCTYYFGLY